ncbi:hypothetical protein V8C86DRAFT_1183525 [Haematococcus lacustris]
MQQIYDVAYKTSFRMRLACASRNHNAVATFARSVSSMGAPMHMSLGVPRSELTLDFCLPTGQSFRWRQLGDGCYTGVIGQRLVRLVQQEEDVVYQVMARGPGWLRGCLQAPAVRGMMRQCGTTSTCHPAACSRPRPHHPRYSTPPWPALSLTVTPAAAAAAAAAAGAARMTRGAAEGSRGSRGSKVNRGSRGRRACRQG